MSLLVAIVTAHAAGAPPLIENVTPSLPLGLYRRVDRPIRVGATVAIRQPGVARPYLAGLGFPREALLLKRVAAVGASAACARTGGVTIDGRVLPRRAHDRSGVRLPMWSQCRPLAASEVFVVGDAERSFDSRYFGPVLKADVVGVYETLR